MSELALGALGAVGVLVGLVGVVVPVAPGLLLVWGATAGTLLVRSQSVWVWAVVALLTVLAAVGTVASIVLPARRTSADGVPRDSLGWAVVGGVAGFVVVPVLGLLLGAAAGLLLAERRRLGAWQPAVRATRRMAAAYGVGVLVEGAVGVAMGLVWLGAFVLG